MLLRRITAHFRKQEWTAIALDFLIVVLGVFMGVQVNGWWTDRIDARRETTYLIALKRDFESIIAEIKADADLYAELAGTMEVLLEQSRKPAPDIPLEQLNFATSRLLEMVGTPMRSDTYVNLTGSGDLAIIRNQELKRSMTEFFGRASVVELVENTHELQLVGLFQPYVIRHLDYVELLSKQRELPPPAGFAPKMVLAALPTQEFRNIVAAKWDAVTDMHLTLLRALDEAREVEILLARELESVTSE